MADRNAPGLRPDFATIGGLVLAFGGILGGLVLEGGHLHDVAQITAAFIVLGGTIGAVLVNTPKRTLIGAVKRLKDVFLEKPSGPATILEEILGYAAKARKNGIVSLEDDAESVKNPFLKKALNLAIDGTDLQEIRAMMEIEMGIEEHQAECEAKVFESAGGYAPTVGIIGAVMGLIQVMKHLENIDEVGRGIAVAFVATVYGVGLANLILLPAASKIKARAHEDATVRELMLEGVIGIVEGLNPKLIRSKLMPYVKHDTTLKANNRAEAPLKSAAVEN
ncbi:MAG TPA: flagellar motor protein [Bryobacteraceae bacterium]|nr:flagellar motor protein [Bryobacteraceae bacterium]